MGGLQRNVVERSKLSYGEGEVLLVRPAHIDVMRDLSESLSKNQITHNLEYRMEVMLRNSHYLSPAIVHGVYTSSLPPHLQNNEFNEAILGPELARKLGAISQDSIQMISPAHSNPLFRDIPRSVSFYLDGTQRSHVPEADGFYAWVDISKVHNLIRERLINRIRIDEGFDKRKIERIISSYLPSDNYEISSWEDSHQTLVWALSLETSVMVFLFIAMTILVSLCIVSGLLLFFDKVQLDLSSFWILGASKKKLDQSVQKFFLSLGFLSVAFGLIMGVLFLFAFDRFGPEILPTVFVDRKIPVEVTIKGLFVSFFSPLLIAFLFMHAVLRQFRGQVDYLDRIRSVG